MAFNARQFLDQTVTAPMSTMVTPCPEGEWQARVIDEGNIEEWFREAEWTDKSTGEARSSPTARIPFIIIDQRPLQMLKREKLIVPYDIFLDVTPDGRLDTGEDKNVRLGALRAALGQNADTSWGFSKLWGAGPCIVKVSHRSDAKDPLRKFAQVDRVAKLS